MTFVGFPVTSLEKYSGDNCQVNVVEEKCIDLILSETLVKSELTQQDFENWKQSVPLAEPRQKNRLDFEIRPSVPLSLTAIMQQIMSFPIERKSPLDCMGIDRLESHIRRESQNYKEDCYVLKMDIRGYFMQPMCSKT